MQCSAWCFVVLVNLGRGPLVSLYIPYKEITNFQSQAGPTVRHSYSSPVPRASMLVFDRGVRCLSPGRTQILCLCLSSYSQTRDLRYYGSHATWVARPVPHLPALHPPPPHFGNKTSETALKTVSHRRSLLATHPSARSFEGSQ